ncbi:hypothetical protein ACJX0J_006347, partial [Zea mays]
AICSWTKSLVPMKEHTAPKALWHSSAASFISTFGLRRPKLCQIGRMIIPLISSRITGHFIAQCPDNDNDQEQEKHEKREKKKVYKKVKGEAHLGKEWDSDCSSSDSDDEGFAASAFDKSSLFPNERHTCLMAKEKKVIARKLGSKCKGDKTCIRVPK